MLTNDLASDAEGDGHGTQDQAADRLQPTEELTDKLVDQPFSSLKHMPSESGSWTFEFPIGASCTRTKRPLPLDASRSRSRKQLPGEDYRRVEKESHLSGGSVSFGSVSFTFFDARYAAYAFRKVSVGPLALCCRWGEACRGRQPGSVGHPLTGRAKPGRH